MQTPLRIGLLFDSRFGWARNEVRGAIRYARAHRLPWLFAGGPDSSATRALLRRWHPDGLLAAPGRQPGPRSVPTVSPLAPDATGAVTLDNAAIGRLAAHHFLERGFHDLAFVGERGLAWSAERGRGFEAAWKEAQAGHATARCLRLDMPLPGAASWRPARPRLSAWLSALSRPTGLMACRDLLALEIVQAVRDLGLRIPEDIAIIGVDNDDLLCELADPPLSSIAVPWEQIGYHMGERLDRLLHGKPMSRTLPLIGPGAVIARRSSDTYAVTDAAVARAGVFLREHAEGRIGVADIARAAGVSRRSLERRFRRTLGRSPLAELRRLRLELARALLRDPAHTLAYIAARTGFGSSQRLSTVFRKQTGETPGAYRASFRFNPGGHDRSAEAQPLRGRTSYA